MPLWSVLVAAALAQDVDGFVEARVQGYAGVDAAVPLFVVERFRPTFSAPLAERIVLSTTIELGLGQGWTTQGALSDVVDAYDLDPTLAAPPSTNELLRISRASNYLAVDRLLLELQLQAVDLRIGRQALNWGSGFVVNPSDPFPEVLLTEPWKPRSGMNAVRAEIPFGDLNSVQLVVGSDDAFTHPRLAARATVNALETDWSLVGAWREEVDEGIVGLDIKGTLGVGFWFEGVVHLGAGVEPYEEFIAGIDYSFPVLENLVVTAQYYRNGAARGGVTAPSLLDPPRPFAPAFSGQDYVIGSVSGGITPDASLSALWMQNLNDGTAFAVPSLTVLPTGSFEISIAGQLPLDLSGTGGEFKPSRDQLMVDLPAAEGGLTPVDLSGLVPDATVILWSRINF